MSIEDTIGFDSAVESCVVCGKNVAAGGGFARLKHAGKMLSLCCPLCLETFRQDSQPYLERLEKNLAYAALRKLAKP